SLNWLHDYVDVLDIPVAGLINGLTLSTCEVDGVETIYAHLDIVRVARVLKVDKHPDADRLSVCKVQSGKENLTIVCGAPNVRADMLVPLAPVGARLPMGNDEVLEIKKAKIRGVESSGMLCAPSELGLEKITGEVDGLLDLSAWLTDSGHTADETGYALSELFPLADTVLDIDNKSITHRPDLWSHFGFAREIGAIFRRPLKYDPLIGGAPDHHAQGGGSGKQSGKKKSAKKVHKKASTNSASSDNSRDTSRHISKATSKASLKATVQKDAATTARVQNDGAASPAVCSHGFNSNSKLPQKQIELEDEAALAYFGRHISGVRVQPSPLWMQARLLAIGQRPINNIVDVSNYVMFETGQPNHAFDARRLQASTIGVAANGGRIKIKNYTTLDGEERAMPDGAILILDGPIQSKTPVVALGGIMGGAGSEVADDTTELFLESATFPRERIRPTISAIGLRTDSAQRFEKGQDPARARPVLDRFTALLALSCPDLQAGKISGRQVVKNRISKVNLDL
ncbi:MAG: phenylalanine--tRNA ligase subunit beta, partial [Leptospiraceae bacterium]|nr:phenylalanine--tRNA ligase subunit beta [Leptospiraceae bacterium]